MWPRFGAPQVPARPHWGKFRLKSNDAMPVSQVSLMPFNRMQLATNTLSSGGKVVWIGESFIPAPYGIV